MMMLVSLLSKDSFPMQIIHPRMTLMCNCSEDQEVRCTSVCTTSFASKLLFFEATLQTHRFTFHPKHIVKDVILWPATLNKTQNKITKKKESILLSIIWLTSLMPCGLLLLWKVFTSETQPALKRGSGNKMAPESTWERWPMGSLS